MGILTVYPQSESFNIYMRRYLLWCYLITTSGHINARRLVILHILLIFTNSQDKNLHVLARL